LSSIKDRILEVLLQRPHKIDAGKVLLEDNGRSENTLAQIVNDLAKLFVEYKRGEF